MALRLRTFSHAMRITVWYYIYLTSIKFIERMFISFPIFLYLNSGMPHRSAIFRLLTPGPVLLFRQNYSFNGQNIDTVIDIIHIIIHFILNDRRSTVCLTIRQKIGLTYQPVSHKSVRISLFMAMDIFHHCCLPQTLVRMAICLDLTNLQPIWGKNTRSHCTSVPFFMPSRYFFELKWLERK